MLERTPSSKRAGTPCSSPCPSPPQAGGLVVSELLGGDGYMLFEGTMFKA